jgi:hypothetical protein
MRDDGENLREPSNLRVVAGALLEHLFFVLAWTLLFDFVGSNRSLTGVAQYGAAFL